ncbi:dihydroneopterin aldolase [Alcaligenes sp. SDU_A2]|uniref:dihydroneopterin aldolase n=1 Tax=Alcaligenes sp. SDU_A2 TaxID=3136634 RepID=UPI002D0DBDAF|nr:dihydroneopterin aldolase [Alcaligenes sp.]
MPTRRIFIKNLIVDASIGILDHELTQRQPLHIDAEFDAAITQTVDDTDIASVLDYRLLRQALIEVSASHHTNLLETLVEQLADRIQNEFPAIERVKIRVSKPQAFPDCDAVGIEIERSR